MQTSVKQNHQKMPVLEREVFYHPEYSDPPELSQGKQSSFKNNNHLVRSAWTAVNLKNQKKKIIQDDQ